MGSLAGKGYPGVSYIEDKDALQRQLVDVVNRLLLGKTNNTGTVTLTANAATTTLTDARISGQSVILLMPTTANAAGALATTYLNTFTKGSCVINHANNAQSDKTFTYVVVA